jgi:uncharacterized protein (TIGR04255 family)
MDDIPLRGDPRRPAFKGRSLLERAVAAVLFSPVAQLGIKGSELAAAFQEEIRHKYPLLEEAVDTFLNVNVDDGKVSSGQEERRKWIFRDIDKHWTVVLMQDTIALEGRAAGYSTWGDFVARLVELLAALQKTAAPSHVLRLGVRYLNTGPASGDDDPRRVCAKQLVSITGSDDLQLADLFWVMSVDEGGLFLRSGVMPPGNSYDPSMFEPRDMATWYLDIDVSNSETFSFEPDAIEAQLLRQASRLHAVYYWAMPTGETA